MGGKSSGGGGGGAAPSYTKKYEVSFDIDEYLDKTDPEKKALRQRERLDVLADSILKWMAEEGRPIDVDGVREDLDQVLVEYMAKVKNGNPLGREQMEELNRIYDRYGKSDV